MDGYSTHIREEMLLTGRADVSESRRGGHTERRLLRASGAKNQ